MDPSRSKDLNIGTDLIPKHAVKNNDFFKIKNKIQQSIRWIKEARDSLEA
jgi:hypothetical protein